MITEDTLLILGAGASFPYGYPTGKELRHIICKEFPIEYDALFGNRTDDWDEASTLIRIDPPLLIRIDPPFLTSSY